MKRILLYALIVFLPAFSNAQILGGGTDFSNAVMFNQAWLSGCPSAGTVFSNQKPFEPTDPIDPCAPTPACATGTTAADVWYSFIAQGPNATIVVNPTSGFDAAIQAFSGTTCAGLTEIGCLDLNGNNQAETMFLIGLTPNQTYYFRVFGAANNNSNRTGLYTFCGSADLGSSVLPVDITRFTAAPSFNKVTLLWTTASELMSDRFIIEKSADGARFEAIATVSGAGNSNQPIDYSYVDMAPYATITYYRLKQVDINGSFKYSAIIPVRMNEKLFASVAVSPNPVVDKININIHSVEAGRGVIRIVNANGAVVQQLSKELLKGINVFSVGSMQLSKGVYMVQVTTQNEKLSVPFVVN